MKKYAERSEAKKKNRTIKRGPKKLNFGASKPGVRGGPPRSASVFISDQNLKSPGIVRPHERKINTNTLDLFDAGSKREALYKEVVFTHKNI